jgi:ABC-type nitrate/sulfonate/bicarbonate transport system substrate-binding protein
MAVRAGCRDVGVKPRSGREAMNIMQVIGRDGLGWALALGLAIAVAGPAAAEKLRYGQIANSARSFSSIGLYVAQRKGFLAREGIELEVVKLPGLGTMIEALDRNEVELSHVASPFLIQAALNGSDAVAVVGGPATSVHSLIAKPDITSFADLKGKVIGMSTRQDTLSIAMRLLLARHGVQETDYQVEEMQGTPVRVACMNSGRCAAAALTQPEDLVFAAKGYRKLGDSLEVMPVLQFVLVAARRNWAAQNRDVVVRFARAFADSYRYIRDPAHRDDIAALMAETMEIEPAIANAMLRLYFDPDRGVLPRQGEISLAGVGKVIELLGETGQIGSPLPAVERFLDLQYLQAAGAM